jgi:hypothetical protein
VSASPDLVESSQDESGDNDYLQAAYSVLTQCVHYGVLCMGIIGMMDCMCIDLYA